MWSFKEIEEGEPERMPRETEFFKTGNRDMPDSPVRETIQNSLDAWRETPVRVRFSFGSHKISENHKFYKKLLEHVRACNLPGGKISEDEPVSLLVAEDFGTTGLTGNIRRDQISKEPGSNFYNFWWREGIAQKYGRHGGRWGLGKITFHMLSQLRSFWGLTIRDDDKRTLLLGKSLLKPHHYKGKWYQYYGYFADRGSRPIEDKKTLKDFCTTFGITRKSEPGLSIVIPAPVKEICPDAIIRATVMHYFLPIVRGILVVEIQSENAPPIAIDSSNLRKIACSQNWEETPWCNRSIDSLMDFVESIKTLENTANMIQLDSPDGASKITESFFGGNLEFLRSNFRAGQLLGIRVPVKIKPLKGSIEDSFFDVFLKREEGLDKADEFYWRSGILILDIKRLGRQPVRALLSADDQPVSAFLGDSETPAHTDWNERTEDFKEKYDRAASTLRFIKGSIREIVRILGIPREIEPDFLKEIFYIKGSLSEKPELTKTTSPTRLQPSSKPPIFDVSKIQGGFRVSLADTQINLPVEGEIVTAYNVRRGNPFKKYSRWDFDLSNMSRSISGGRELDVSGNRIRVRVNDRNFELRIRGFDPNRDVIVRTS